MTDKWLRSDEVLSLIEKRRPDWAGNDDDRLLPFLSAGMLRARAAKASFKRSRTQFTETNWEIPSQVWAAVELEIGPSFFDLDRIFVRRCYIGTTEMVDIECLALTFNEADLCKFGGLGKLPLPADDLYKMPEVSFAAGAKQEPTQPLPKRPGGRHPSVEGWSRFAAALAVWIHKRNDEALGIASVGPDELLAEMDHIAMNELPKSLSGDLPRGTYQAGAAAVLEAFSHLARK